jgi:hypothetical protein
VPVREDDDAARILCCFASGMNNRSTYRRPAAAVSKRQESALRAGTGERDMITDALRTMLGRQFGHVSRLVFRRSRDTLVAAFRVTSSSDSFVGTLVVRTSRTNDGDNNMPHLNPEAVADAARELLHWIDEHPERATQDMRGELMSLVERAKPI